MPSVSRVAQGVNHALCWPQFGFATQLRFASCRFSLRTRHFDMRFFAKDDKLIPTVKKEEAKG